MLKLFTVYSSVYPEHFKACENRNRPVWEKLFSWEEEFAVELKDYYIDGLGAEITRTLPGKSAALDLFVHDMKDGLSGNLSRYYGKFIGEISPAGKASEMARWAASCQRMAASLGLYDFGEPEGEGFIKLAVYPLSDFSVYCYVRKKDMLETYGKDEEALLREARWHKLYNNPLYLLPAAVLLENVFPAVYYRFYEDGITAEDGETRNLSEYYINLG